ncbi:MAG: hypothetical protein HY985_04225 [Magnetospirillum sp.]|nr:hypothetical protein [Magnetospirillum sp.]
MAFALTLIHEFVKFVGLLLIGQFLVYALSFGRHERNPVYAVMRFLTSPVVKAVRYITPAKVADRHVPVVAFILTFWAWVILIVVRLELNQVAA